MLNHYFDPAHLAVLGAEESEEVADEQGLDP